MRYHDIREAFPSCGIAVTDYGIMIIFPMYQPERYTIQTINNREFNNKDLLLKLLSDCNALQVRLVPNVGSCLLFEMQIPIEQNMFWGPLRPAKDAEELSMITLNAINDRNNSNIRGILNNIDINDQESVFDVLTQNVQIKKRSIFQLSDVRSWELMRSVAYELAKSIEFAVYNEEPPNESLEFGVTTFDFGTTSQAPRYLKFNEEQTTLFTNLCIVSDVISLEGYVGEENAAILIEFYS